MNPFTENLHSQNQNRREYHCGIYLRLSKEDGEGESNSISGQRVLIQHFLEEKEDLIYEKEWVDDGYTGTNFNRPGFQAMIKAATLGEIDCIVVKDLSRLGREYILTGTYLQKVFPSLGIRFISVTDCYDSLFADGIEDYLLLPIRSIMNDAYCLDISRKVKASQYAKRNNGEYMGAFAPYGYKKRKDNYHELAVDEFAAKVVRFIYSMYASGCSAEQIADCLVKKKILAPCAYKKQVGSHYRTGFSETCSKNWSATAVRRILHDETYTGVLLQGRSKKISYKRIERICLDKSSWIKTEGKMEAIIPKWFYDQVQHLFSLHLHKKKKTGLFDILEGLLNLEQNNPYINKIMWIQKNKNVIEKVISKVLFSNIRFSYQINAKGVDRMHKNLIMACIIFYIEIALQDDNRIELYLNVKNDNPDDLMK